MKKTDKPSVVINIYGDNNKVYLNETRSHVPAVAIGVIIVALVAVAVLAVSCCCPELLPDFVRWIIGKVGNGGFDFFGDACSCFLAFLLLPAY